MVRGEEDDNGLLTILTSDTMSMLAISIFIPTPTGAPGTDQKSNRDAEHQVQLV